MQGRQQQPYARDLAFSHIDRFMQRHIGETILSG